MTSRAPGLLLVHAHPDDESITTGVTMAAAVDAGLPVTLVTCTRGEEGEIIPAQLADLAAGAHDTLGPHREGELAAAMAALGVRDHRFLRRADGGRWRDSGMFDTEPNSRPEAFWRADVDEAAEALAEIIREVRPATLITYDPQGGYGHPDHIQAHRVATRAAELASSPGLKGQLPHQITRILWTRVPRGVAERELARLAALLTAPAPGPPAHGELGVAAVSDLSGVVADTEVRLKVVGTPRQAAAKADALRAHVTQIAMPALPDTGHGPETAGAFALSNNLLQPVWATEYYQLAAGEPPRDEPETALFTPAGPAGEARPGGNAPR